MRRRAFVAAFASLATLAMPSRGRAAATVVLRAPGVEAEVALASARWRSSAALQAWLAGALATVARYYGTFPVPRLRIAVEAAPGDAVEHGQAFPGSPPLVRVVVGRDTDASAFADDWMLVHELVHLALPELDDAQRWLSEGLATYVEGIARVQAGALDEVAMWLDLVHRLPQGLPRAGDAGLDRTHTWARTYWGGALFCLEADVGIREATGAARGLQDALRAIARRAGGMRRSSTIDAVLALGDAATGTRVLGELYRARATSPSAPDLAGLWQRLGIDVDGGTPSIHERGPGAAIRRAITQRALRSEPTAGIGSR